MRYLLCWRTACHGAEETALYHFQVRLLLEKYSNRDRLVFRESFILYG
jgi:hypothetical protein